MEQGYAARTSADAEGASRAFKRHILDATQMYPSEPMADLYRVNLLGEMLDRYDALTAQGLTQERAVARVRREFADIADRMREEGFAPTDGRRRAQSQSTAIWPSMSEDEAARYIEQSEAKAHRRAMGIALCSGSVGVIGLAEAVTSLLGMDMYGGNLGAAGMFAAIGVGVYLICLGGKPEDEARVRSGRFSLSSRLRGKLGELKSLKEKKARRRRAMGIALCATCVIPLILMADIFYCGDMLGLAGMFAMVGAGVYEIMMSVSECGAVKRLLGQGEKE